MSSPTPADGRPVDPTSGGDPSDGVASGAVADPRRLLVLAGRILADESCASGVGGQVSMRAPNGDGFYAAGFELLGSLRPDIVAHLGPDLDVRSGSIRLPAGLGTHARIYRERDDVNAVIHLHSHHVSVLSSTRSVVGDYHVSAALFSGAQVVHVDDGSASHSAVVDTLGDKRFAIIANHGALIVSDSIANAVVEAVTLEECARIHLGAVAAGGSEVHPDEMAASKGAFRTYYLVHMWEALSQRALEEHPRLR